LIIAPPSARFLKGAVLMGARFLKGAVLMGARY
jgi:hypothetical protein